MHSALRLTTDPLVSAKQSGPLGKTPPRHKAAPNGSKMVSSRWWVAALIFACVSAAPAGELVITSFDGSGRLSFQGIPDATAYRVEWATNLSSAAWSSNAPGLPVIPASGSGELTVTVGVFHAACFYRVVATGTQLPPTGLTNQFDLTSEGWRVVHFPFLSHDATPDTSFLLFDGGFGNPAGSVRVGDEYPETGIAAPAPYLGDRLAFYGGWLAYDIYLRYTDDVVYPAVVLNGGSRSLYYCAASPPVHAWQHRTVPLWEDGWRVSGTDTVATQADFKSVLANLVGLYIYTEWSSGPDDDTNVDNITMTPP